MRDVGVIMKPTLRALVQVSLLANVSYDYIIYGLAS